MNVMKTSKPNVAFVLTNKDLSKLNEHIRDFLGSEARVTYSAHCADLTRTFDDFSQLQKFENPPRQAIQRLKIDASSKGYDKRVDINLGSSVFDAQIDMSISGPEQSTQSTVTKLEDVVQGMKAWYSIAATFNLLVFSIAFAVVTLATAIVLMVSAGRDEKITNAIAVIVGYSCAFSFFLLWGAGTWLRSRLFPKAVFALGQGENRHKTMEIWRQLVYVGLPVSVLGSLIAGVILLLAWH